MKVLHLLASGKTGGIERLCKDIILKADWDNRICCLFDAGEIYEELKSKDKKVFSLKDKNRNKKSIVQYLVKYCKEEKIDIITIHHGGINCNLIYMMLKKRLPNIKFVRYLHGCFDKYSFGNDQGGMLRKVVTKYVMQKAFNVSDLLVFISKAVERSFQNNFNIKKINKVVIYNGIDDAFFEREYLKKNIIKNIIFVGRLSYVKGVNLLIDAFKKVYEKKPDITLTIVGDGEEKQNLINQAKELNLQDSIFFAGRQSNVIDWLDNAEIFVYPSIWEEGFGISVVEAMSRGCIPITFNKGGLSEIIENGKDGFLIDSVDSNALASKIIEVTLMNDDEIQKIRNNAMETSKKYSIDNTILSLKKEYNKLNY